MLQIHQMFIKFGRIEARFMTKIRFLFLGKIGKNSPGLWPKACKILYKLVFLLSCLLILSGLGDLGPSFCWRHARVAPAPHPRRTRVAPAPHPRRTRVALVR